MRLLTVALLACACAHLERPSDMERRLAALEARLDYRERDRGEEIYRALRAPAGFYLASTPMSSLNPSPLLLKQGAAPLGGGGLPLAGGTLTGALVITGVNGNNNSLAVPTGDRLSLTGDVTNGSGVRGISASAVELITNGTGRWKVSGSTLLPETDGYQLCFGASSNGCFSLTAGPTLTYDGTAAVTFGGATVTMGGGLNITSAPLQLGGATGASGNLLISQGGALAPAWTSTPSVVTLTASSTVTGSQFLIGSDPAAVVHVSNQANQQAIEHGSVALVGGTKTITFNTAFTTTPPDCFCSDGTALASCDVPSGSITTGQFVVNGTTTDTVLWFCIGRR